MTDTRVIPPSPEGRVLGPGTGQRHATEQESDVSLMHRAAGGDSEPYSILFWRHADRIRMTAFLMLPSAAAADVVVQETFTRGLSYIRSYRGEAEPSAWFSSIALNLCRLSLRDGREEAARRTPEIVDPPAGHPSPPPPAGLADAFPREDHRLLTIALGYLTVAQREVFVLHFVDGLPYEDVARIMNIRAGAARALSHRAKLLLHKKLGEDLNRFLQA